MRDFLRWVEGGAAFSQEETALFLEKVAVDRLPAATVVKLERLDLLGLREVLSRNLEVLLNERSEDCNRTFREKPVRPPFACGVAKSCRL